MTEHKESSSQKDLRQRQWLIQDLMINNRLTELYSYDPQFHASMLTIVEVLPQIVELMAQNVILRQQQDAVAEQLAKTEPYGSSDMIKDAIAAFTPKEEHP